MDMANLSYLINNTLPYQNMIEDGSTVLIGTANMGPKLIPVRADGLAKVIDAFGPDSQITNAFMECTRSGGENIYLIKLNGTNADTTLWNESNQQQIRLESIGAGLMYNRTAINVYAFNNEKYLEISSADTPESNTYKLSGFTIADIVRQINNKATYGASRVYATIMGQPQDDASALMLAQRSLAGGSDEVDMSDTVLFDRIALILEQLKMTSARNIGIINSRFHKFIDPKGFIYELAVSFTSEMESKGKPCLVTLGLDTQSFTGGWRNDIDSFISAAAPIEGISPARYTINEYVNLILCRLEFRGLSDFYYSDGVASYCGLIDAIEAGDSTTNKKIPGAFHSDMLLDDEEIKDYTRKGFVTVFGAPGLGFRIYKGVNYLKLMDGKTYIPTYNEDTGTFILEETLRPTPLVKLSNANLMLDIRRKIADKMEPLIGNITNKEEINLVADAIARDYPRTIQGYDIVIEDIYQGSSRDYNVTIVLEIYGEIEGINVSIQV